MDYETLYLDYELGFDAKAYRDVIVSDFIHVYHFLIRQLHQVFTTEAKGKTILDVGCGPSVYTALLASRTFDDIVLSEFVPGNREQLERWIRNESNALDWSPVVEYVARVEGYIDLQKGAEKISQRTRNALRKVIPCNVTSPGILAESHRSTFDAVVTSLCLEAAVMDDITYCAAVADIGRLIRPGGSLILCGLTGNVGYTVGKKTFKCFPCTEDLVRFATAEAGFVHETWNAMPFEELRCSDSAFDTAFVTCCKKL